MLEECHRGEPLTPAQWISFLDENGAISNDRELRKIVFHGGIEPEIRVEVWKYLLHNRRCACIGMLNRLNQFSPTLAEREAYVSARRNEYFAMKQQWTSVTPKQLKRNAYLTEQLTRYEKTDNNLHLL